MIISLIVSIFQAFTRTLALSFLLTAWKSGLKFYYQVAEWKIPLLGFLVRPHEKPPKDMMSHRRAKSEPKTWACSPLCSQLSVTTHQGFSKNSPAFPLFCLTVYLVWPKVQIKSHLLLSIGSSPLASCSRLFLSSYHQFSAVLGLSKQAWSTTNIFLIGIGGTSWETPKLLHWDLKKV